MISESTKDKLNRLPLDEVMRNNGYESSITVAKRYKKYRCPFHGDKDPSFRVDLVPGKGARYCGTHCYGACEKGGDADTCGAIQLQQNLLKLQGEPHSFEETCIRLARDFNMELEGKNYNDHWHRQSREEVPPEKEIKFNLAHRPFTDEELRALGCKVECATRRTFGEDGEEQHTRTDGGGKPLMRYSFDPTFYHKNAAGSRWDSTILTRMFNLYPLRQTWESGDEEHPDYAYISRAEKERGGDKAVSHKIYATRSYPIFVFMYEDGDGWYARRYEPYCKPRRTANGGYAANYKFTWWYEGNRVRENLHTYIYGDNDVMRALKEYDGRADVRQTDDTRAPLADRTYMQKVGESDVEMTRKVFDKIIICSGPRDAINTYFHSDAHVVWPHSETSLIPEPTMRKLFALAETVYIMYDIDDTGIAAMNRMGLKYPDLRLIDLPEEIQTATDRRTDRPCKDAEQYFNHYRLDSFDGQIADINEHFACLLNDAKSMKFWDTEYGTRRGKNNTRHEVDKFTINYSNLTRFLQANGVFNYKDEAGASHYVRVEENIVDVIDDKDFMTTVKLLMKKYLFAHKEFNSTSLKNAISTQKKIDAASLKEIKCKPLNFDTWGKDHDWFFFPNCAAKVTADGITAHSYNEMDGHVNRRAILGGGSFYVDAPLFTIVENPEYRKTKERFERQMADRTVDVEDKLRAKIEFLEYEKLWRWKLDFTRPMEEMPPCLQFVWDTCRIHWRSEEMGLRLSPVEEQQQKMHFVNKAASIGYLLSRYRTDSMQQMTTFTDYRVQTLQGSHGGTGKTTYLSLLESVRKVCKVGGDNFVTTSGMMASNFQEFVDSEHQLVSIDDLKGDIRGEEFKNLTTQMTVKTLYKNKYSIPKDRVPKIFCTMNRILDMSNPSVYRRCFDSYTSDYYHPSNKNATELKRTPYTKFGKDFIKDATPEEYNAMRNMMLQFCQFYLRVQDVISPPMDQEGKNRQLYEDIGEELFVDWANDFFDDETHFCRPLSEQELVIDYIIRRKDGEPDVNRAEVKNYTPKVRRWLEAFCTNRHISMNPHVVYAPKIKPKDWENYTDEAKFHFRTKETKDEKNHCARHRVWVSKFEGDKMKTPRERTVSTERTLFFFRLTDVIPLYAWDLGECGEIDWELKRD